MTGKVVISPHPIKTKERINFNGDVIDPNTKRVIVPKEVEIITTPPEPVVQTPPEAIIGPVVIDTPKDDGLSVLEQIEATKRKLAELEEAKKKKIEETEKLLNELKK